jgi:hypothetical protein
MMLTTTDTTRRITGREATQVLANQTSAMNALAKAASALTPEEIEQLAGLLGHPANVEWLTARARLRARARWARPGAADYEHLRSAYDTCGLIVTVERVAEVF